MCIGCLNKVLVNVEAYEVAECKICIERMRLPILKVHAADHQYRTIPDLLFEIDDILYIEAETGKNVAWRKSDFESSSYYKKILYYQELYDRVKKRKYPPFRVLTVCRSLQRLNVYRNLCKKIDSKGRGLNIFWFALEEDIELKNPSWTILDPIWYIPSEEEPKILLK